MQPGAADHKKRKCQDSAQTQCGPRFKRQPNAQRTRASWDRLRFLQKLPFALLRTWTANRETSVSKASTPADLIQMLMQTG